MTVLCRYHLQDTLPSSLHQLFQSEELYQHLSALNWIYCCQSTQFFEAYLMLQSQQNIATKIISLILQFICTQFHTKASEEPTMSMNNTPDPSCQYNFIFIQRLHNAFAIILNQYVDHINVHSDGQAAVWGTTIISKYQLQTQILSQEADSSQR